MDMTEKIQEKGQNYLRHDRIFPNGTGGGETDGRKQRIDDRILSGKANMCRDRYGMLWETAGSLLTKERMNEHESQAQGTQRADGGCTVGLPAGLQLRLPRPLHLPPHSPQSLSRRRRPAMPISGERCRTHAMALWKDFLRMVRCTGSVSPMPRRR